MKVAYVATFDPEDGHKWSGTGRAILDALRHERIHVQTVGNLSGSWRVPLRGLQVAYRIMGKTHLRDREPAVVRGYAQQIEQRLAGVEHDIVFSPGSLPVAQLDTDRPIVFWTDATFAGMIDYYPDFSGLSLRSLAHGTALEQAALERAALAIYSSEWAARTAIDFYDVDPAKVHVVPFGANLAESPAESEVHRWIRDRSRSICRLLFVGVDFLRKGGDIAIEVAAELNRRGVETELHVVGGPPPEPMPDFIRYYGRLSKTRPVQYRALCTLFARSSFFILPTRAEAYGLVFAEASAHGLPSIGTDTGGVGTVVERGKSGELFAPDTPPAEIAAAIARVWSEPEAYLRLALGAYEVYRRKLNWKVAGRSVRRLLDSVLERRSARLP